MEITHTTNRTIIELNNRELSYLIDAMLTFRNVADEAEQSDPIKFAIELRSRAVKSLFLGWDFKGPSVK